MLVLRDTTERPEAVSAGTVLLVGTAYEDVLRETNMLLDNAEHYRDWILAVFVAVFQGAIQALSRSYFTQIIPTNQASEYFGVFDIFGKGASFMGTLLMGIVTQLTDSSKYGVIVIAFMFVVGGIIFKTRCND